jgi:hypothetical protein
LYLVDIIRFEWFVVPTRASAFLFGEQKERREHDVQLIRISILKPFLSLIACHPFKYERFPREVFFHCPSQKRSHDLLAQHVFLQSRLLLHLCDSFAVVMIRQH